MSDIALESHGNCLGWHAVGTIEIRMRSRFALCLFVSWFSLHLCTIDGFIGTVQTPKQMEIWYNIGCKLSCSNMLNMYSTSRKHYLLNCQHSFALPAKRFQPAHNAVASTHWFGTISDTRAVKSVTWNLFSSIQEMLPCCTHRTSEQTPKGREYKLATL